MEPMHARQHAQLVPGLKVDHADDATDLVLLQDRHLAVGARLTCRRSVFQGRQAREDQLADRPVSRSLRCGTRLLTSRGGPRCLDLRTLHLAEEEDLLEQVIVLVVAVPEDVDARLEVRRQRHAVHDVVDSPWLAYTCHKSPRHESSTKAVLDDEDGLHADRDAACGEAEDALDGVGPAGA